MQKKTLILGLVMYVLSSAVSYSAFSLLSSSQDRLIADPTENGQPAEGSELGALLQINPGEPKDQPCPLNGKLYTNTERAAWEKKRPLAVMIENHPEARPQSGLSQADIVFEANAEGGVTREMGIFYCDVQRADTTLGPVRSARYYFVSLAGSFNRPIYTNVGGSNIEGPGYYTDALGYLNNIGWASQNNLNQFSIGYPTFVRDYNRLGADRELATEHTMVTSTEKLWDVAAKRKWTNMSPELKIGKKVIPATEWKDGFTPWKFQKSAPTDGNITTVSYEYWDGFTEYGLRWEYDAQAKAYKRIMAGQPHIDLNNNQQIMASTVIVMKTVEKGPVNEKKHMVYQTTGTGDALIFMNGQVVEATWAKKDLDDSLKFTAKGKDVELAPGLVWVSMVSDTTDVTY
jgi:hypothetical protein